MNQFTYNFSIISFLPELEDLYKLKTLEHEYE